MMAPKIRCISFSLIVILYFGACSSRPKAKPRIEPQAGEQIEALAAGEGGQAAIPASKPLILTEDVSVQEENKEAELRDQEGALAGEKDVDPAMLLEDALSSFQEAQQAWETGDQDSALRYLDEAYSLIARVQLPADSPLLQEKANLRLLIAQRIQQIYASRLVVAGDNHKTIPLAENRYVNQEIQSFQTRERKEFEDAYRRSGLYRDMILDELRKAGLPEELAWLPMIESWFKVRALSSARALGMWQFISSTGYKFGLKPQDRWVDERMDPIKATQAAVKYLGELHALFGDWQTALAAYNCGETRVQYVIKTQRVDYLDNFWDLFERLPFETARFVPRFTAAMLIINSPEKYGFTLPEPSPPLLFESIVIKHPFKLSSLAANLAVEPTELALLNPELRQDSTPDYGYRLRVPVGKSESALTAISALPRWVPPEASYFVYSVRNGETLSVIARRFRSSVQAIARLNGLRSVNRISLGQRLKIPGRDPRQSSLPPADLRGPKPEPKAQQGSTAKSAGQGSTGKGDAREETLPAGNGNGRETAAGTGETGLYRVSAGDTLFGISQKLDIPLAEILTFNGLTERSTIYPGQEIRVKLRR